MLSQRFTKSEIHQLANSLFKDIPFQTESGKEKMKAALHLYRSGNVYNIERDDDNLRATMLVERTKVHIFFNMKTGFYHTQSENKAHTAIHSDVVYIAAALLGLFASVDSVGAFLDLWKAHHLESQTENSTDVPTAIGNDYFIDWITAFHEQFETTFQKKFPSKEKLFITCNQFIVAAMDKERKSGLMRGLSFSYIPLYIFYQLFQNKYAYKIHPMEDTFVRRLIQLAENELEKLPKDIFIKHTHTNIEVSAYQDLLNNIVSSVGLMPIAHLYGVFFTFDFKPSIHEKQLTWWKENEQFSGYNIASFFHSMQIHNNIRLKTTEIPEQDTRIYAGLIQKLLFTLLRKEQLAKLQTFLPNITPVVLQIDDENTLTQLLRTYVELAKYDDWREKCQSALKQFLPTSLPQMTEICWEQGNYKGWVSLLLLAPKEDMQAYEENIRLLYEKGNVLLLPLFHRIAKEYIEEKNKEGYQTAIFYIRKLKRLYKNNNLLEEWQTYLKILQEHYGKLRSFQNLLLKEF